MSTGRLQSYSLKALTRRQLEAEEDSKLEKAISFLSLSDKVEVGCN